jgi:uncharacterized protein DUF4389
MIFEIRHQESYSRGELLLRTFFGYLYIALPHLFLLFFLSIWSSIVGFIAFWSILFTGRYPESFFEFQTKFIKWEMRVNARMMNLVDGYPAFGLDAEDENIKFYVPYREDMSRGNAIIKLLFGWLYVGIPHGFVLFFRVIGMFFVQIIAFWIVLFTGEFPKKMHDFIVGTQRWAQRVNLYLAFMTDEYPPFTGHRQENELGYEFDRTQQVNN